MVVGSNDKEDKLEGYTTLLPRTDIFNSFLSNKTFDYQQVVVGGSWKMKEAVKKGNKSEK